jgi:hypothetical protein
LASLQPTNLARRFAWEALHLQGLPSDDDWTSFWLFEASANGLPRDFIIGVCAYYQELERIEAGNAADMLLAAVLLDADAFLTADRRFHRILQMITTLHGPLRGEPIFVEQNSSDFCSDVKEVVREADQRHRAVSRMN